MLGVLTAELSAAAHDADTKLKLQCGGRFLFHYLSPARVAWSFMAFVPQPVPSPTEKMRVMSCHKSSQAINGDM